jgi:hypothetical protein
MGGLFNINYGIRKNNVSTKSDKIEEYVYTKIPN